MVSRSTYGKKRQGRMSSSKQRDMSDDTGVSKKRGPRGLASSKSKKRKVAEKVADQVPEDSTRDLDADSKTIALPGDLDEDDEVGQLIALYSTAVEFLKRRKVEDALPIINGTVHEADRILRNKPDEMQLPYEFHSTYANALLDLSMIVGDSAAKEGERVKDYIEAATERCNVGMDHGTGDGLAQLQLTKAKCICCDVQLSLASRESDLSVIQPAIDAAIDLVDGAFKVSCYVALQLETTFKIIQDFADSLLDVQPEVHESINRWVESKWTKVLTEDQENVSALEGCGRVWLSLAQPYLSDLEELNDETAEAKETTESSQSSTDKARECLETSVELLNQAVKCAEKANAVTGELLCLLAESTISLANTFDEGPQYDRLEAETMKCLKRAQAMDDFEMPERFAEMLQDEEAVDADSHSDSKVD